MNRYEELRKKSIILRTEGHSLAEISKILNISKSTASLWSKEVVLSYKAIKTLKEKSEIGRQKSIDTRHKKIQLVAQNNSLFALNTIKNAQINNETMQIFCSLLYWGEGSKNDRCLRFTNSDHKMLSTFLQLLRKSFSNIDEGKFRCVLQLHDYHNEAREIDFWSKITKIPKNQFTKTYHKKHTGTISRAEYHGTLGIKYCDSNVVDRLIAIYNRLSAIGV